MTLRSDIGRLNEGQLRARLALLEEALEAIADGFILFDADDRVVTFNENHRQLFPSIAALLRPGISYKELLQAQYADGRFGKNDKARRRAIVQRIDEHRNPRGPVEQTFADGRVVRLSEQVTPSGGIVAVRTDITELRQAQEDLRQRHHQLLDNIAEAAFGIDMEGRFTFANRSCVDLLGFPSEAHLLGRDMHALVHPSDEAGEPLGVIDSPLYTVLRDGDGVHVNTEVMWRADGSSIPVSYRAHPVMRDGERVGAVVTFLDVTAHREAQRERDALDARLRQAHKMEAVGQLAGGVAHDFNNILTGMLGFTELLLMEMDGGSRETLVEYLHEIRRGGERAREVVYQLLAFSRVEPPETELRPMAAVVEEALSFLLPMLPPNITVEANLGARNFVTRLDSVQLHRVVLNLCINARDAMRGSGGGAITVSLAERSVHQVTCVSCGAGFDGLFVELCVEDEGTGIEPAVVAKMFDPFFSTKAAGIGTGMGLSVVHGIVHEHGGHVLVDAAGAGGALFRVFLPALEMYN
ncbi:MAG: PAS domain S-box protein [Gammaproteobacteria bacterium]|nr:PAS domain S-box protein [Gammaproteobacteria bacterium]